MTSPYEALETLARSAGMPGEDWSLLIGRAEFRRIPRGTAIIVAGEQEASSAYTIEALEDSEVIEIPYRVLKELMDASHAWERFVRKSVERLYIRKEERERELLYLTALQRYEAFRIKYPGLDKRIPQYHIASYLGISPVSLSRLLRSGER